MEAYRAVLDRGARAAHFKYNIQKEPHSANDERYSEPTHLSLADPELVMDVGLGFLNLYVAFNYPEKTWVNFKVFGVTSMLFIFMIGQTIVLRRYLVQQIDDDSEKKD